MAEILETQHGVHQVISVYCILDTSNKQSQLWETSGDKTCKFSESASYKTKTSSVA
jgi:hypothetical protein